MDARTGEGGVAPSHRENARGRGKRLRAEVHEGDREHPTKEGEQGEEEQELGGGSPDLGEALGLLGREGTTKAWHATYMDLYIVSAFVVCLEGFSSINRFGASSVCAGKRSTFQTASSGRQSARS